MTDGDQKLSPTRNAILQALPAEEIERLAPYLKTIRLTDGERLFALDEPVSRIWFPQTAVVSRLVQVDDGETVEAGIVGYDGVVGGALILGSPTSATSCIVQLSGQAICMQTADFEEHVRVAGGPLLDALHRYISAHVATLTQLIACHALHRIEQRLSRCILQLHDCSGSERIRITHDMLSDFLGVHRPSVTFALQALAATGAIALERRSVAITARETLVERACECYSAIRRIHGRLNRQLQTI